MWHVSKVKYLLFLMFQNQGVLSVPHIYMYICLCVYMSIRICLYTICLGIIWLCIILEWDSWQGRYKHRLARFMVSLRGEATKLSHGCKERSYESSFLMLACLGDWEVGLKERWDSGFEVCLGEMWGGVCVAEGHSLWIRLSEAFSQAGSISETLHQMETKKKS